MMKIFSIFVLLSISLCNRNHKTETCTLIKKEMVIFSVEPILYVFKGTVKCGQKSHLIDLSQEEYRMYEEGKSYTFKVPE